MSQICCKTICAKKFTTLRSFELRQSINLLSFRTASKFCSCISRVINISWQLRGSEHLGRNHCCVIVANHQSSLDVLGELFNYVVKLRS